MSLGVLLLVIIFFYNLDITFKYCLNSSDVFSILFCSFSGTKEDVQRRKVLHVQKMSFRTVDSYPWTVTDFLWDFMEALGTIIFTVGGDPCLL